MMLTRVYESVAGQVPALQKVGLSVSRAIHRAVLDGGPAVRRAADALHGTWLGHPLHAILTDITVGAFSFAACFDVSALLRDDPIARRAGTALVKAGVLSAVPTALSGITDYSTVPKPAAGTAALHGGLNTVLLGLYLVSLRERSRGEYRRGAVIGLSALGLAVVSAWLGGHLVYGHRVGVDNSERGGGPSDWTAALPESALAEGDVRCVEVGGRHVLLSRIDGRLHAIEAVCAHAGGPLQDGAIHGHHVHCPWHQSVFDLRTGGVIHGPSVHPQPAFAVRVEDGMIQVRKGDT